MEGHSNPTEPNGYSTDSDDMTWTRFSSEGKQEAPSDDNFDINASDFDLLFGVLYEITSNSNSPKKRSLSELLGEGDSGVTPTAC